MKRGRVVLVALMAVGAAVLVATQLAAAHTDGASAGKPKKHAAAGTCTFGKGGKIKHLIYIQFDNVHFLRDNPNVPSDLEQMPNLLNFIRNNGTLDTNDHSILISHTGGGILSTLTGLYPDRHGQAVSNSYNFFRPDGTSGFSSTFKYWTDLTDGGNPAAFPPLPSADPNYNMVNNDPVSLGGTGAVRNTPAPWVPFAKAGCDVGNVGVANTVLENNNSIILRAAPTTPPTTLSAATAIGATNVKVASVTGLAPGQTVVIQTATTSAERAVIASVGTAGAAGTGVDLTAPLTKAHASGGAFTVYATDPTGDMTKVFGSGSPEWNEGRDSQISPSNTPERAIAQTDFVGIAIHCAAGGGICNANAANARPDPLPDEVGLYPTPKALFGAKYVNPAITKSTAQPSGTACVNDTNGNPVVDPFTHCGFPGFDGMYARNTLGYVAQMQEAGVPITFAYISDAHDNHGNSGNIHVAYGPGEAGYVQQLRDYDKAFGDFFKRLNDHGITKDNTLFAITVEEGDHFGGTAPDAPCDGVTIACTYNNGHVTEVNGDLKRLVATYNAIHGTSVTTNFFVHSDMAPNVYANKTGNAALDAANARALEKAMSDMRVTNPLTGVKDDLFVAMADPVEMKTLHMVTADPARTPTFTPFAQGDYFLNASSTTPCADNNLDNCVFLPAPNAFSTFAWNHGGIQPEVATTWIGWVGPGIEKKKQEHKLWTDHTDVRPTILALMGLKDSYVSDGRVVTELLKGDVLPKSLHKHHGDVEKLGRLYKQINASFGQFAADTLTASTRALASNTAGDATFTSIENAIAGLTSQRDTLADKIRAALNNAEFNGQPIDKKDAKAWNKQGKDLLRQAHNLAAGP